MTDMATSAAWIIYKTDGLSAPGWEERLLQPSGALTSILAEEHDYSGVMPKVGDRVREYTNLSDPDHGVTHGRDGSWVVSEVQTFAGPDSALKLVVCVCSYQPIEDPWQSLQRGAPIDQKTLANVLG